MLLVKQLHAAGSWPQSRLRAERKDIGRVRRFPKGLLEVWEQLLLAWERQLLMKQHAQQRSALLTVFTLAASGWSGGPNQAIRYYRVSR